MGRYMNRAQLIGVGLGAVVCAMASTAVAQSNFDRDRNVSVRERPRPEYQARGLPLGAFTAYPKLTVGAEYNDNIFASGANTEDDMIYKVEPELVIQSGWSRHSLQAFIRGGRHMYEDFPKESTTDYQGGISGHVDAGYSRIAAGVEYGRYTEPRTSGTSPTGTAKPVEYTLGQANIALTHTFNRLRLSARADLQEYDYEDGHTAAGAVVEQDDRDRQITTYSGRAEYALSPDTSLYLAGAYDERDYDLQPPATGFNRNSKGMDVSLGANFDLSSLLRGEIQVGYVKQDYDAAAFNTVEGVSARALVEWFPSEIDTVTFAASRSVADATIAGASGFLTGNYSVQVDHELLRNLILTARVGLGKDEYEGADRTDDRLLGYVGANYLINRGLGFTLSYDYLKQDSDGAAAGPSFEQNRVMVSSTLQF